ncbi:DUF2076 family protein [Rhodoplanes serenus]|uniref:DUF2076 family protein n=1 Tax=Rhodoplanes serenus TaxID=200615 RepID=A0A9X4XQE4_9BRAD|nr:DUF2076 domain-containing protein [Rhodoplanes serenus]MTW17729.1 DUF2076 family protein [Rhodoplanes serenus]
MTPQERQLVDDLFQRLATLEREPRDPEAERAIREGLSRAPNAVYALVQTTLLQDEALRQAHERIAELEAALAPPQQQQGGFLGSLRGMFGGDGPQPGQGRGSVPSVRPGEGGDSRWNTGGTGFGAGSAMGGPMGAPAGYGQGPQGGPQPGAPWGGGPGYGGPGGAGYGGPGYGGAGAAPGGAFGGRGSFLGTAAAAAAGVIGGSLLLDAMRGMTGGAHAAAGGAAGQGALDPGAGGGSPFGGGAGGGDLSREAGVDDIGGRRTAAYEDPGADDGGDDFGGDFGDSDYA